MDTHAAPNRLTDGDADRFTDGVASADAPTHGTSDGDSHSGAHDIAPPDTTAHVIAILLAHAGAFPRPDSAAVDRGSGHYCSQPIADRCGEPIVRGGERPQGSNRQPDWVFGKRDSKL